jgi:hypothetical protein
MEDLINSMTQEEPARRPQIEEVLEKFTSIRRSLRVAKLRSPIISRKALKLFGVIKRARHSVRTVEYIVSGRPAIPDPYASVKSGKGNLLTPDVCGLSLVGYCTAQTLKGFDNFDQT